MDVLKASYVSVLHESCSLATLTIHAELIARLIRKHRPTHVAPLEYVKNMIETLIKKENGTVKNALEAYIS